MKLMSAQPQKYGMVLDIHAIIEYRDLTIRCGD